MPEQGWAVFMDIVAENPQPSGQVPMFHAVRSGVHVVPITAQHAAFFVETLQDPHRLEHHDADAGVLVAADQLGRPQSFQSRADGHVAKSLPVAGHLFEPASDAPPARDCGLPYAATLAAGAGRNAGITSAANRSSCSRITDSGVPMLDCTLTVSSPGNCSWSAWR